MAAGKLCASLCPHPYKSHHFHLTFVPSYSESVFAIPKFKSFFGWRKTNGIHNSSVGRFNSGRALSLDLARRDEKWILLLLEVKRCRAIANVDCPSVSQLVDSLVALQFSIGSHRRRSPRGYESPERNKINGFGIDGTNNKPTKDANQSSERAHWPKVVFRVTNSLAWILYIRYTRTWKCAAVGLSECPGTKCLLLFAFVVCTKCDKQALDYSTIHREKWCQRWGKGGLPRGMATTCLLSETNLEEIIIVVQLGRRRASSEKTRRTSSGGSTAPVDRNVAKSVLLYIEFGFTHDHRNTFQHFHPMDSPSNLFARRNLFVCVCAWAHWIYVKGAACGAKMFTCVHIKVTINHYIGADGKWWTLCPFRPSTVHRWIDVQQYFGCPWNPHWLIKRQVLPLPREQQNKCASPTLPPRPPLSQFIFLFPPFLAPANT